VWSEIVAHCDDPGFVGIWVSIADAPRTAFDRYPWSIGGGGAAELKTAIDEDADTRLESLTQYNGITAVAGEGEVYVQADPGVYHRSKVEMTAQIIEGEQIRDWSLASPYSSLWVYNENFQLVALENLPYTAKFLYPFKANLSRRKRFGVPMLSKGLTWYEWQELYPTKLRERRSISFSEITSHNHFVFDQKGFVFDNTTRVIKLGADASEEQHLELLGLLNSSTSCFWLKQICFPKGGDHVGTEGARVTKNQWEERYVFDSTKLKQFPIPEEKPLSITRLIQVEADARSVLLPDKLCAIQVPTRELLGTARDQAWNNLGRMIALQEELDWQCYRLYGIVDEELTLPADRVPNLNLGERAFEIVLARAIEEPLWFERHHSTPITEIPSHWPECYRNLVEKRIALIATNRDLALIERPEYKRRWNLPSWK